MVKVSIILLMVFLSTVMADDTSYLIISIATNATMHDKLILQSAIRGTFDPMFSIEKCVAFSEIGSSNSCAVGNCYNNEEGKTIEKRIDDWIKDNSDALDDKNCIFIDEGKKGRDILKNHGWNVTWREDGKVDTKVKDTVK